MNIKMILALSAILSGATPAYAGIETDKTVGNCVGYLATRQKESGMRAALAMADNQRRAMQFADSWLKQAERYKTNKGALEGMVYSANSDCREIGIRPSEY